MGNSVLPSQLFYKQKVIRKMREESEGEDANRGLFNANVTQD